MYKFKYNFYEVSAICFFFPTYEFLGYQISELSREMHIWTIINVPFIVMDSVKTQQLMSVIQENNRNI